MASLLIKFPIKNLEQSDDHSNVNKIPNGYRVACVEDVKQVLRRETKEKQECLQLQELALLPGLDNAFRLKNGYLFDFGVLKSFYPQYEHKLFTITHKLLVATSISEVEKSESDAALELLHACDEEDEEEIENIVIGYQKQLINLEKHYIKSSGEDEAQTSTADEERPVEVLTKRSKGQLAVQSGYVDERRSAEVPLQKASILSSEQLDLLYAGTPWVNGGTALHFSVRATKMCAVRKLLHLEKQSFCQLGLKKGSQAGGAEECDDTGDELLFFQSKMVRQEDYEGNTPICLAAIASPYTAEQYEKASIPNVLLHADGANVDQYQHHMKHENMMGLTPLELALGCGHFQGWSLFHAEAEILQKNAIKTTDETWKKFLQERGVYKAWLLLLSRYANQGHFRKELDNQCKQLNLTEYIFEPKSSTDKQSHLLNLFLKALEAGFFTFCQTFLNNEDGKMQLRRLVMGSMKNEEDIDYARNDVYSNNILHLYAKGGADENCTAVNEKEKSLRVWKLLENVLNEKKGLLQQHADAFNLQGLTPFMLAVKHSHLLACQFLKPHSSDKLFRKYILSNNDVDESGENIIHWYAKSEPNIPVESWIIPENFSQLASVENSSEKTPLELAFESGHTKACVWLLDHVDLKKDTYKLAIYWYAAGKAEKEAGEKLLEKLDGEKKKLINQEDEEYLGRTPLMAALAAGNKDACHLLLDQVDCDAMTFAEEGDRDDNNLLHCWCLGGILDATLWKKLTDGQESQVKEHFKKPNKDGYTPFMLALKSGNVEFCNRLLEILKDFVLNISDGDNKKSNVFHAFVAGKCKDESLWNALINAHMQTSSSSINPCLSLLRKALTQRHVISKETPFNMALQSGSEDCALLFLRGIPPDVQICNEGVLKYAAEGLPRSFKVWSELIKKRHTNSTSWHQNAILHKALKKVAKEGSLEVFDMILQTLEKDIPSDKLLRFLNAKGYDEENYGDTVVSNAARCQDLGAAHLQLLDMRKGLIFSSPLSSYIRKELTEAPELDNKVELENVLFSAIFESNACACSWLVMKKRESPLEDNVRKVALWFSATRGGDYKSNDRCEQNAIAVFKILLEGSTNPKLLLESLSDVRGKNLIHVVKTPQLISYILQISPSLLDKKDKEGFTPLFECTSLEKMHVLIRHAVDNNKKLDHMIRYKNFHEKTTLLHMQINNFEKVAKLVQWISEIEFVIDQGGETILHAACKKGLLEVVRLIIHTKRNLLHVTSLGGKTPFHVAVGSSQTLVVKELLEGISEDLLSKFLLDERDGDGRTALHFAAESKDHKALETVKLLLEKAETASIDGFRDKDYRSLLLWASAGPIIGRPIDVSQREDVTNHLKRLMASIEEKQINLLDDAVKKGSKTMVKELINRGANPGNLDAQEFSNKKESDQPTIKDSLGRVTLAKGIAALLLNPFLCTPITVGIFAPWGMGKSSIMQQIDTSLMMTIIHRNLLGAHLLMKNDFPNPIVEEQISKRGKNIKDQVLQMARNRNKRDQTTSSQWKCASWICQICSRPPTVKHEKIPANNDLDMRKFFNEYHPEFDQLYKGLALMEREALVKSRLLTSHKKFSFHIPSFLTVHYNAWAYHGEVEASAGLAMTISREIEACLSTARWLRLCFKRAYKRDPVFMISSLIVPIVVCVAVGGWIMWLVWKLMSIKGNQAFKDVQYGSIPVSVLVVTWVVLQRVVNVVKPISEQLARSLQHKKGHQERLGYQRQVIEDINMFKRELTREPPHCIWRVFAMFWKALVKNRDYIEGTSIAKEMGGIKNLRIVVFVDDLDRCSSHKYTLELLTAINLILSVCDINVVMGVDKSFIEKAIQKEYENKEAEVKFLEKIVQVPVDLYDPDDQDTANFLDDQLRGGSEKRKPASTSMSSTREGSSHDDGGSGASIETNDENSYRANDRSVQPCGESVRIGTHGDPTITTESTPDESIRNGTIVGVCDSTESIVYSDEDLQVSSAHHDASITIEDSSTGEDIGNNELVVDFPILVSNYNEIEIKTFQYLRPKAKTQQRQPRNWKRLLNYHRLVWSIISLHKPESIKDVYGWQEQLIIWVFLCYNWKEQMNELFKEWDTLLLALKKRSRKENGTSIYETCTLRTMISLKISTMMSRLKRPQKSSVSNGDPQSSDNLQISLSREEKREWKNLLNTINDAHDVTMKGVKIFQNFRFQCDVVQLRWIV